MAEWVAEVDRDSMRQRRERARGEIEAQERQRADAQPQAEAEASKQAELECWICYSGTSEGELVSPCKCRGTMQWVHRNCLHKWITTRITPEHQANHQASNRFACPNCETPFEFVGSVDDDQPDEDGDEIWPSSGRWWLPNVFPRIDRLAEIDDELCNNFRWKFASPIACVMVQATLVGFTLAQVCPLYLAASRSVWWLSAGVADPCICAQRCC